MNDKKLWKVFSEYIRLRDSDKKGFAKCFTCPNIRHWTKGDCGHGIGRQHKGVKFNEKNNHFQCKPCNGFEQGKREVYKEEMDKRYGPGTWDLMDLAARKPSRVGQFEIDMLTRHYKEKVDLLRKQKFSKLDGD